MKVGKLKNIGFIALAVAIPINFAIGGGAVTTNEGGNPGAGGSDTTSLKQSTYEDIPRGADQPKPEQKSAEVDRGPIKESDSNSQSMCKNSNQLSYGYHCEPKDRYVKGQRQMVTGIDTVGGRVVQMTGAGGGGSLSANYSAASKNQKTAGHFNLISAGVKFYSAKGHDKPAGELGNNEAKLRTAAPIGIGGFVGTTPIFTPGLITQDPVSKLWKVDGKGSFADYSAARKFATDAADEQRGMRDYVKTEQEKLYIEGATSLMAAIASYDLSDKYANTAKTIQDVENKQQYDWKYDPLDQGTGGRDTINPNSQASAAITEEGSKEVTEDDLGTAMDPLPDELPVAGPSPGIFRAGDVAENSGGGGGGALGGPSGGMGQNPSGETGQEQQGAGYARLPNNPAGYGEGGGGKKGGAAGGAGTDGGLLAALAGLMPKEQDLGPKNGILAYRGPAQSDTGSLLDRSVNIFQRISAAYQAKHRAGAVGVVQAKAK